MDRKTVTIILALALISSFFLPYLKFGSVSASGFEIVTAPSTNEKSLTMLAMKYIWLLIPFSSIILLLGALNNDKYFLGRGTWVFLPLLTMLLVIAEIFRDARKIGKIPSLSGFTEMIGVGFWITLIISLVLAFYWPRKKV